MIEFDLPYKGTSGRDKGKDLVARVVFDDDFPYAGAKWRAEGRYLRASLGKDHPLASSDAKGRVYAHRAVLHWKIGPGPHECSLCEWGPLSWDVNWKTGSVDEALVTDHLNPSRNPFDNRAEMLRPACKWCNDNRSIMEDLDIPPSFFYGSRPSDRRALRQNVGRGQGSKPTPYALEVRDQVRQMERDLAEREARAKELAEQVETAEPGEGHPEITEDDAKLSPAAAAVVQAIEEANAEAAVELERSDRWYRRMARRLFTRRPTVDEMVYGPGDAFVTWDDIADMNKVLHTKEPVTECLREREAGE